MTAHADRVLVLTRHYAPEPTGSAPPMQQLAEWLAANGGDPLVVTSRPTYPEQRVMRGYEQGQRDHAVEAGVEIMRLPTMAVKGTTMIGRVVPESRFMMQLFAARLTGKLLPSGRLISLCPSTLTVVGALPFRKAGGRHIVIVHDIQSGLAAALGSRRLKLVLAVLRSIERWALNRADHLIVLSQAMASALQVLGIHTPITILPPQVDCRAITPLPRPAGAPPTLMYSGNLGRKQGLDQILDLAAVLKHRAPEVELLIRGEGVVRPDLEARIARDHLSNVRLLPLVPIDQVASSLAEGDIHLVPQIAEGGDFAVPSKAFAIMAAGRPFVTTATPGSSFAELARETGAFECVPPHDAEGFATCVLALLDDEAKRQQLAANGRRYAEETADTNRVMERVLALFD